jgi:hypothetical protein
MDTKPKRTAEPAVQTRENTVRRQNGRPSNRSAATLTSTRRRSPYSSLRSAAEVTEALVWLYGVLGIIGSVVLMTTTKEVGNGLAGARSEHPYVGIGLGLLLGVAMTSAFLVLFARLAAAWAFSRMRRPDV